MAIPSTTGPASSVARQANSQADLRKIIRMSDYLRHHPGQKTVPDPYYGSERDFEFALELLEDACEGLLEALTRGLARCEVNHISAK